MIFAAFGIWFTGRPMKHANRLLPHIWPGTRLAGTVTGATTETEQRKNTQYSRLRPTVGVEDGYEYHAVHEEPAGTRPPDVRPQTPAVVWRSPIGYVIAAGERLFEAA